jgi:hypothetical protein
MLKFTGFSTRNRFLNENLISVAARGLVKERTGNRYFRSANERENEAYLLQDS